MPRFAYRAVDGRGEIVEGERESADRDALIETLRREGLRPLRTIPRREGARRGAGISLMPRHRGRIGGGELMLLTREISTLLSAGLPLDQALAATVQQSEGTAIGRVVRELLDKVRGGAALSEALEAHPDIFPGYYVGLVRAGEAGGTLDRVTADLAQSLERAQGLRQDIRTALNYPIFVLAAAGVSVLVLLLGVIPEFEPLFESAGGALPVSAQVVMAASKGLRSYWWSLPLIALLFVLAWRYLKADPAAWAQLDARLLRLPKLGPLIRKIEAARFCRTLGTLLANGVDVVPAVKMSARTLSNARLLQDVEDVAPRLRRGEGLSEPLEQAGILPPLALRLIRIGETSGQLESMLATVARIYEEEIGRETKRLMGFLVPVITLLLGMLVAGIIGAILSAILTSYDLPF